jgi:hypothetical protein
MYRVALRAAFTGLGLICLTAAATASDAPSYTITIKDHAFAPAEVTIPANTRVLLLVKNLDAAPSEFESDDFHREKVVTAGDEIQVFVGPLLAGSYEFFDDFHPATRGHLIVK